MEKKLFERTSDQNVRCEYVLLTAKTVAAPIASSHDFI